jgi:hypothetical protein
MAARHTTMLKPAHFQACVTITAASAKFGSPSQDRVRASSPIARSATFTTPQS